MIVTASYFYYNHLDKYNKNYYICQYIIYILELKKMKLWSYEEFKEKLFNARFPCAYNIQGENLPYIKPMKFYSYFLGREFALGSSQDAVDESYSVIAYDIVYHQDRLMDEGCDDSRMFVDAGILSKEEATLLSCNINRIVKQFIFDRFQHNGLKICTNYVEWCVGFEPPMKGYVEVDNLRFKCCE